MAALRILHCFTITCCMAWPLQAQVSLPISADLVPLAAEDQGFVSGSLRIKSSSSAPDGGRFDFQIQSDNPEVLQKYAREFVVLNSGIDGKGKEELGRVSFVPDESNPTTELEGELLVGAAAPSTRSTRSLLASLYMVTLIAIEDFSIDIGLIALVNSELQPAGDPAPLAIHYCSTTSGKAKIQGHLRADPHPGNTELALQAVGLRGAHKIISQPNGAALELGVLKSVSLPGRKANYDKKIFGRKGIKSDSFAAHLHDISLNLLRDSSTSGKKKKKKKKKGPRLASFKASNTPEAIAALTLNSRASSKNREVTPLQLLAEVGRTVDLALQTKRGDQIPLTCTADSAPQVKRFVRFSGDHNGHSFEGYVAITALLGGKTRFDTEPLLLELRLQGLSDLSTVIFSEGTPGGFGYALVEKTEITDDDSVWELQLTNLPSLAKKSSRVKLFEASLLAPLAVHLRTESGTTINLIQIQ